MSGSSFDTVLHVFAVAMLRNALRVRKRKLGFDDLELPASQRSLGAIPLSGVCVRHSTEQTSFPFITIYGWKATTFNSIMLQLTVCT